MPYVPNEFQCRLLNVIAEKNITAADLARETGIDKGSISNYLNGKYTPKQDKVYLLARALDVDPGWLMTGDEPKINRFPDFIELPNESMSNDDVLSLIVAYSNAEEWQKTAVRKILNMEGGS